MRAVIASGFAFLAACAPGPSPSPDEVDAIPIDARPPRPDAIPPDAMPPDADLGVWHTIAPPVTGTPALDHLAVHGATIFVTHESSFSSVYRSADEGVTWELLSYQSIAMSPDGMTIYAYFGTTHDGLSIDGGATWTDHTTSIMARAVGADPDIVYGYRTHLDSGGFWVADPYASSDTGAQATLIASPVHVDEFLVDPVVANRAYFVVHNNATDRSNYRTEDLGVSITSVSFLQGEMRVDPGAAGTLWRFEGTTLGYSDDAGDSWAPITGAPEDVLELTPIGDGSALAFTAELKVWNVTPAGVWSALGTTPVPVDRAYLGATPETVVFVPVIETQLPDRLYVTSTLGQL